MKRNICASRLVPTGLSLAVCAIVSTASAAGQATVHVISYMSGYSQPAGLTEGSPGLFYGIAAIPGTGGEAAFSVTTQGVTTTVASFSSGYNVTSLIVSGPNNRLYSAVELSNNPATVFSVTSAPGSLNMYPSSTLIPSLTQNLPNGTLLCVATTVPRQLPYKVATVSLSGSVTSIHQFSSAERAIVVVYATDGKYYGVSVNGSGLAYLYRLTPSGSFTTLYTIPGISFGGDSFGPLLQASDGNLYGALVTGGANGTGAIYKMSLAGKYTQLYSFPAGPNGGPTALIQGSDGNLYGATLGYVFGGTPGYGQLFRLTRSGAYTLLYSMQNQGLTGSCYCDLVQGSDGLIYGTASIGGKRGNGTVFTLNAGLPKPAPRALQFSPKSGPAGTKVLLWGTNLLSASVSFNGVPATAVTNSGSNYVTATVPTGATTGPITVTTPGGTYTTKASFTVQ